ncbi:hypothetical protein MGMO_56c00030 [Methyloglobulus morosus KoM1]|uniref:DUF1259 domain-containing protein n=1 Tax=Methyloglobulus morosus KoM1 TaxID=1116472 RepID=V5C6T3_9GAMM|nr:LppY/LpqO family protein [Methyloglobulus morosus]ESS72463.1 hypothetical protein MGMO_56c00030 [Methyloglobulus morosus KoM1]
MNTIRWFQFSLLLLCAIAACQVVALENQSHKGSLDSVTIEKLTGAKGKLDATENVFKVSVPRTDLTVMVAGVKMIPAMGFTSWAAFKPAGEQVMVMGDMVLTEDQVNPVLSMALDNGIEVTALHNHFLWDTPRVMFMHIGGMGDIEKLATGVGKVFHEIKKTSAVKVPAPHTPLVASKTSLDPKIIETAIGAPVEKAGEIYKVTISRSTMMAGHDAGKVMGVNTWAAFAGSDKKAVVDGDFAMLESELQGVLKALRSAGIFITAIHHHMTGESPKIVFLHFWGTGSVNDLAKGIKAALDTQASK